MVLDDLKIKLKDFLNSTLLFNLNMTSESEIEDWLLRNFPKTIAKVDIVLNMKRAQTYL